MTAEVLFFPNGNTAVLRDGGQVPELQESWLVLYLQFLELKGYDPTEFVLRLPGGAEAKPFKTSDGSWNWRVA